MHRRHSLTSPSQHYLSCTLWFALTLVNAQYTTLRPPIIEQQPTSKGVVRYFNGTPDGTSTLACQASGFPRPTYLWKHNGRPIRSDYMAGKVIYDPRGNTGELRFLQYDETMEGQYQCLATTTDTYTSTDALTGRFAAVSQNVLVRTLKFPTRLDVDYATLAPMQHRCNVSAYLMIRCELRPSDFSPPATFTWVSSQLNKSIESAKAIVDSEGNLHFSTVTEDLGTDTFRCRATQKLSGVVLYGRRHKLNLMKMTATRRAPMFVYPMDFLFSFTAGQPARIATVFSAHPIPTMWCSNKEGRAIPAVQGDRNHRVYVERFTLYWQNVTIEDIGAYSCVGCIRSGANQSCSEPFEFYVDVKIPPSFIKAPSNSYKLQPGGSVEIDCSAFGSPAPNYSWFINGEDIYDLRRPVDLMNRVEISNDLRKYKLVKAKIGDSHMVQCNVSNDVGYLLTNIYISVEPETTTQISTTAKTSASTSTTRKISTTRVVPTSTSTTGRSTTLTTTTTPKPSTASTSTPTPTPTTTPTSTTSSTTTPETTTRSTERPKTTTKATTSTTITSTVTTSTRTSTSTTSRATITSTSKSITTAVVRDRLETPKIDVQAVMGGGVGGRTTRTLALTTSPPRHFRLRTPEPDEDEHVTIVTTTEPTHGTVSFPGWWVTLSVMAAIIVILLTVFFIVNAVQRLRKW